MTHRLKTAASSRKKISANSSVKAAGKNMDESS